MIMEQARSITKKAKYLSYPITEIEVDLLTMAEEYGLESEMEDAIGEVLEAQNKLESAIFRCEDVFYELEIKESEYDWVWRTSNVSGTDRER